jgi:hypothetical protein
MPVVNMVRTWNRPVRAWSCPLKIVWLDIVDLILSS